MRQMIVIHKFLDVLVCDIRIDTVDVSANHIGNSNYSILPHLHRELGIRRRHVQTNTGTEYLVLQDNVSDLQRLY